jgi:RNA polymerase sigma factor (sigma-70 family)
VYLFFIRQDADPRLFFIFVIPPDFTKMEEGLMLYKNPEENEQRRYRYHNIPLSSVTDHEIDRQGLRSFYREISDAEWRQEYIPKVKAALKTLSPKQSQVINLYIFHEMEQREIALLMNCTKQAVSRLYVRAIKKMRGYIAK